MSSEALRLLFVCTGNSCRSQMAEGWVRTLGKGAVEAFSAGTDPQPIHPLAIQIMAETKIDISKQRSKHVEEMRGQYFDAVITVCDRARENCPVLPHAGEMIRWSFDDPAAAVGSVKEQLRVFRQVSTEIRHRIDLLLLSQRKVKIA